MQGTLTGGLQKPGPLNGRRTEFESTNERGGGLSLGERLTYELLIKNRKRGKGTKHVQWSGKRKGFLATSQIQEQILYYHARVEGIIKPERARTWKKAHPELKSIPKQEKKKKNPCSGSHEPAEKVYYEKKGQQIGDWVGANGKGP